MKKPNELSPVMRHYQSIKDKYPDCIIFYRLGDFYEMFFEDAVEVSKLLELTLTGKDCGLKERAPMCGVPFHAADTYIAKLVSLGKKVAVCEQLTEPNASKGLVERDVVKIVSNGTITESTLFNDKCNNFILCIAADKASFGVAWADITTGDFFCRQFSSMEQLSDCLYKVSPAEIICNELGFKAFDNLPEALKSSYARTSKYSEQAFNLKKCREGLAKQFDTENLSIYIPDDKECAISAAGALVSYLNETQMRKVDIISSVSYVNDENSLSMDGIALKNLEIIRSLRDGKEYGTLLWAVDHTSTAGGGRKIKEILLSPLKNVESINYRFDGVSDLVGNNVARQSLNETMHYVKDLERLCGRVSNKIAGPRDCEAIKDTLSIIPSVKLQLAGMASKILDDIAKNLGNYDDIVNLLDAVIKPNPPITTKEGKFVKDGFDEQLDHYRNVHTNATQIIKDIELREREATGIKNLRISYNKVFGYYIEVTNSYLSLVPENYIRKQTLVGAERFITEELKKFEEEVLTSSEKTIKIENEIFSKICGILENNVTSMQRTAKCLSMLDVLLSFATVSKKRGYVRPEMLPAGGKLNIVGGKHPVLDAAAKINFIPNDTLLDSDENRMMIITGPNMAGKSTYMRQVALITVLAHAGCFVPAKAAEIPIIDKIFTRVGASDNLIFNQSTFMVEMTEVADILINATKDSLLILDEVGRGTSTFDGLSIAWAVVEYLAEKVRAKTLFATHYHELSELEGTLDGVKNYKISVKEINGEIVFLRKITRGSANKSFGIEVASLSGIPKEVTQRAKKILNSLEKNDITFKSDEGAPEVNEMKKSFVDDYISKLDLNNVTPLKAFEILAYLKSKTDD
ncbi:MAG: DNA mismatch repair protein MutS [Clostridia bacterium]|nr:DNA mismatch repair protein MutS [Clostridia bacterium]